MLITFFAADLIRRLDEENKVNMYLCHEKLPKVNVLIDFIHVCVGKENVIGGVFHCCRMVLKSGA